MSTAADGHNTATEHAKLSRRRALSMMATAVPLVTAPVALASPETAGPTPLFLEILEARKRLQPLLSAWLNMSPRNQPAYDEAHDQLNVEMIAYQGLIDRLFAVEVTSWPQVAELNAVWRSEDWDGDKAIDLAPPERYALPVAKAIEKLSGVKIPDFDYGD